MFELCMRIKKTMDRFGYPWFIAGGWAIDLFLDRETRIHEDIEIGIYRKHQMKLYGYFDKNKKYYSNNKSRTGKYEKLVWNKEYLRLPIHELYIKYEDIELEVLLNEKNENEWIYRRNEKIKLDEKKVILFNRNSIPYLCPEIVLLYKTKELRSKDIEDISNTTEKMNDSQLKWLFDSIEETTIREKIKNLTIASSR